MKMGAVLRMVRGGDIRARLVSVRDGRAAVRMAAVGAGLRTGLLDFLHDSPQTTPALARRGGWSDESVVDGLLRVLAGMGLVRSASGGWHLTRRGRAVLEDDVVRATYEGFSDYHVGLYQEIEQQLTGGPARRDIIEKGDLIARLSRVMDPFVLDALGNQVKQRRPGKVLDVGCGSASHLAHMLELSPGAAGVGIETDPAAVALARTTIARHGLAERAEIVEGDVREVLDASTQVFDFALLANVVYYLRLADRLLLLRAVADHMEPGGAVMVVTTALTDAAFSRHFDLLLRTQQGDMGLPDIDVLADQMRAAGLTPGKPRRIAPGEPLTAVVATRL